MINSNSTEPIKNLKCNALFLNIRSLRNKLDEIKAYAATNLFDLIILNEIWIKKAELPYFAIDGYESVLSTKEEAEGGGSMILIKKGISYKICLITEYFNTIIIEITSASIKLKVLTCYITPTAPNINEFLEHLDSILASHQNIVGFMDSNFDMLDKIDYMVHS